MIVAKVRRAMLVLEFKVKGKPHQYAAIDEAIRTAQFVRNKALRYWMDNRGVNKYDLSKYCRVLAREYDFANELNSMARQASAERAWSAISRFFENCRQQIPGKKGYPRFKKNSRSVEYKTSGWKLLDPKHIVFTDKKGIGRLKLIGTWDARVLQHRTNQTGSAGSQSRWLLRSVLRQSRGSRRTQTVRKYRGFRCRTQGVLHRFKRTD